MLCEVQVSGPAVAGQGAALMVVGVLRPLLEGPRNNSRMHPSRATGHLVSRRLAGETALEGVVAQW